MDGEDKAAGSGQNSPQKRQIPLLHRILMHGMAFSVIAPAIGAFIILLLTIAFLVPAEGPVGGLSKAFASSNSFLATAYVVGIFPSLFTGLLFYPLWRQFDGGWQAYVMAGIINCALCSITGYLFVDRTVIGLLIIAIISGVAAVASIFMTRKLRL